MYSSAPTSKTSKTEWFFRPARVAIGGKGFTSLKSSWALSRQVDSENNSTEAKLDQPFGAARAALERDDEGSIPSLPPIE